MPNNDSACILDCDQLRDILSVRYPHLMVDRVLIQSKHHALGIKNVTMDEPCFQGHFPGYPVFPGVFMLETMIQTGGALIHCATDLKSKMAFLLAIDRAKFRRPVHPGDQLKVETELLRFRRGVAQFQAAASVRNESVGQAVFTIGFRDDFLQRLRPTAFTPEFSPKSIAASSPPIMDTNGIMKIIPHRFPFLMVDAVLARSDKRIVALKNVTGNESFFSGHFQHHSVMPGTLLVESMAQAGAVFMLDLPQYQGKIGYFMALEEARFRCPVQPGDQLILDLELVSNRPRIGRGIGQIRVGDTKVADARFSFVITDPLSGKSSGK